MIMITGAAGGIGKRMAQRFFKQGIDFIGIDYVNNPELPETMFEKLDAVTLKQLIENPNGLKI